MILSNGTKYLVIGLWRRSPTLWVVAGREFDERDPLQTSQHYEMSGVLAKKDADKTADVIAKKYIRDMGWATVSVSLVRARLGAISADAGRFDPYVGMTVPTSAESKALLEFERALNLERAKAQQKAEEDRLAEEQKAAEERKKKAEEEAADAARRDRERRIVAELSTGPAQSAFAGAGGTGGVASGVEAQGVNVVHPGGVSIFSDEIRSFTWYPAGSGQQRTKWVDAVKDNPKGALEAFRRHAEYTPAAKEFLQKWEARTEAEAEAKRKAEAEAKDSTGDSMFDGIVKRFRNLELD